MGRSQCSSPCAGLQSETGPTLAPLDRASSHSDVGIALAGIGSDIAIETADVVINSTNLLKVEKVIQISRKTRMINRENIALIVLIKSLFLLLGAIGVASMWGAVFADVGVTILTVTNAQRVSKYKSKNKKLHSKPHENREMENLKIFR